MNHTPVIPRRQAARVLIIDDEARLREIWQHAIASWGFAVSGARSAEEALRLISASPIDIAIVDLDLPLMGGIELFQQLRSAHPGLQVIVVTGFGNMESARAAIQLGVVDFIQKPCPLGELEQALARACQKLAGEADRNSLLPRGEPADTGKPPGNRAPALKLQDVERDHILAALARNGGNRTATAAVLGISRRALQYKLTDYQRQGFDVE